jgi:hypothetical protein
LRDFSDFRIHPQGAGRGEIMGATPEMHAWAERAQELQGKLIQAEAENKALREALECISTWRKRAHEYDDDTGYKPREFDEEDLEMVENCAKEALSGPAKEGVNDGK